jgi:uncharacterized delta-60 repeat protein
MSRKSFNAGAALAISLLVGFGVGRPAQAGVGDLDVRFGRHGQAPVPGQVESAALVALPDGRILVFGVPGDQAARDEGSFGVARLLADGDPDATFAPGGYVNLNLGAEAWPVPTDALLLPDGRILLAGYFAGNSPGSRSNDRGWLVRLSADATIDSTFGVNGVARAGSSGLDRITLLTDGAIAAGSPGLLHRLEANGAPSAFPGTEALVIPVGSGYPMAAMAPTSDGGLITSAGYSGPWDSLELFRISASGLVTRNWGWPALSRFTAVDGFAPSPDRTSLMVCGSGAGGDSSALLVADVLRRRKSRREHLADLSNASIAE